MSEPAAPVLPASTPTRGDRGAAERRMVKNVAANWLWFGLVFGAGFVLPPLINRELGREMLGIWDFGWAFVMCVALLSMGVTSAVNRYVARYRADRQWQSLSVTASSSLALLLTSSVLGLGVACVLAALLPRWLPGLTVSGTVTAQAVILILCGSAALQIPAQVFNGIITGFERFDLLNAVRILRDLGVLIASIVLLWSGFGIVALAVTSLIGEIGGDIAKISVARRLCPQLRLSPGLCHRQMMGELLRFGGKTIVQETARGGLYQISGVLLAVLVGPSVLAVYARQRALVMVVTRFVKQYAQVFVPTSSGLQALGDLQGLRRLAIVSAKYGLYLSLPVVAFLTIMGGPLLQVWMGADFVASAALAILALGHLAVVPQLGLYSILMGLGRHGVPAASDVGAFFVGVGLTWVLLAFSADPLTGAALGLALPLALSGGIVLPLYACRVLHLSPWRYVRETLPGPFLAVIPWAACLLGARALVDGPPVVVLLAGVTTGALATIPVYWRWVLPPLFKAALIHRVSLWCGA